MNIAFVILHYQTIKETKNCVVSILNNIDTENYRIIIVDNGSPNESGISLKADYKDYEKIDIIINNVNVGFAKGHNIGINYIKKNYKTDFIVLLNNDTEIIGENWCCVIDRKYKDYKFGVLGPDIILPECEKHANPMHRHVENIQDIKSIIKKRKRLLVSNYLFIDSTIKAIKNRIKKIIKYQPKYPQKMEKDALDVQLQGSCFILSTEFFKYYEGLYNKTFLYFEEEILRYMCERDGVKMVYTPDIVLLHKESVSTKESYYNLRKKNIFFLKHSIDSCHYFYQMIKNDI